MRNGSDYLASLNDNRCVFVDGERVDDVVGHPAFAGIARTIGELYDTAADPVNRMTVAVDGVGEANKVFALPRSREDLAERRAAITMWANISKGFVGRSPDHVGGFLAGFASDPEVFNRGGRDFADNVSRAYRDLLEHSWYYTYVIVPPQIDRSTTAQGWEEQFLQVGVVGETDDGIVLRGSQMLGTATAVSDRLFVSCIKPLQPGDEDYAVSFVVPVAAPGLKVYCRRPYAVGAPSSYDYPLSTRFDESDALIVFDDVHVPWDDVFVYRDIEGVRDQFFKTPAHILGNTQAQIRLVAKLKFMLGIAHHIASANGVDRVPAVHEKLGELASLAAVVEGLVLAAEAESTLNEHGVAVPHPRFLYGAMGMQAELYPRVLHIIRDLAGAGLIQVPSSFRDLTSPETRPDIERYIRSPALPAEERIKLFKLAWDIVGSEFAGRHHQYEMFYAGAPFVARGYAYRNYGYDETTLMVDEFLKRYGIDNQ